MSNIDRLRECLGDDCTVTRLTYLGRAYAVTQGTGEGGSFAYPVSELRADELRAAGWDYSLWCCQGSATPATERGLARKVARLQLGRLLVGGSCRQVLTEAEYLAARDGRPATRHPPPAS